MNPQGWVQWACTGVFFQVRTAMKRSSGSAARSGTSKTGKRLGVKVQHGGEVVSNSVIVRQRGRVFHPGVNVKLGRDYTAYALDHGYVRFYTDPACPKRKFVGVVPRPDMQLPFPKTESTLRNMMYRLVPSKLIQEVEEHDRMAVIEEKRAAIREKHLSLNS